MALFNLWVWEIKHAASTKITRSSMVGIIPGLTLGEIAFELSKATDTIFAIDTNGNFTFTKAEPERKEPNGE